MASNMGWFILAVSNEEPDHIRQKSPLGNAHYNLG
jgi:hypothetical protein